jgi:hypothetical protein
MSSHASASALAAVRTLAPVGLDELTARAALQQRVDTKYIVFPSLLTRLVDRLGAGLEVLEIDGRRQFRYDSTYFDTPDLRTYRDHVKGRRRRFKARTRTYADSGLCMFEIKLEGGRATTEKLRSPHPLDAADTLTDAARRRLDDVLAEQSIAPVGDLGRATGTAYRRITLTDHVRPVRITVDTDLVVRSGAGVIRALEDRLLIEVKAPTDRDPVHHLLHELGVRPLAVSKYAAGLALLHPDLPRAPWARTLRRHFPVASADAAVLATEPPDVMGGWG